LVTGHTISRSFSRCSVKKVARSTSGRREAVAGAEALDEVGELRDERPGLRRVDVASAPKAHLRERRRARIADPVLGAKRFDERGQRSRVGPKRVLAWDEEHLELDAHAAPLSSGPPRVNWPVVVWAGC
jgi:hypothetical protein